jgi:hypothetical protein
MNSMAHPRGHSTGVYNRCLDQANVQPQEHMKTSCRRRKKASLVHN